MSWNIPLQIARLNETIEDKTSFSQLQITTITNASSLATNASGQVVIGATITTGSFIDLNLSGNLRVSGNSLLNEATVGSNLIVSGNSQLNNVVSSTINNINNLTVGSILHAVSAQTNLLNVNSSTINNTNNLTVGSILHATSGQSNLLSINVSNPSNFYNNVNYNGAKIENLTFIDTNNNDVNIRTLSNNDLNLSRSGGSVVLSLKNAYASLNAPLISNALISTTSDLFVSGNTNIYNNLKVNYIDSLTTASTLDIGSSANKINIGCSANIQSINLGSDSSLGNTTINLGGVGDTVNIAGTVHNITSQNLLVSDKLISLNVGAVGSSTARDSGIQIRDNNNDGQAYIKTDSTLGQQYLIKAPENAYILSTPILGQDETIATTANISGLTSIYGTITNLNNLSSNSAFKSDISGLSSIYGTITNLNNLSANSYLKLGGTISGNVDITGTLYVTNASTITANFLKNTGTSVIVSGNAGNNSGYFGVENQRVVMGQTGTREIFSSPITSGTSFCNLKLNTICDGAFTGASTMYINGATLLNGASSVNSSLNVSGTTQLNSTLNVSGTSIFNGYISTASGLYVKASINTDANINALTGNLSMGETLALYAQASGNTTIIRQATSKGSESWTNWVNGSDSSLEFKYRNTGGADYNAVRYLAGPNGMIIYPALTTLSTLNISGGTVMENGLTVKGSPLYISTGSVIPFSVRKNTTGDSIMEIGRSSLSDAGYFGTEGNTITIGHRSIRPVLSYELSTGTTQLTTRCGIGRYPTSNYQLDVNGDANLATNSYYRISGNKCACMLGFRVFLGSSPSISYIRPSGWNSTSSISRSSAGQYTITLNLSSNAPSQVGICTVSFETVVNHKYVISARAGVSNQYGIDVAINDAYADPEEYANLIILYD